MTSSPLPWTTPLHDATTLLLVRHAQSEANASGDTEQDSDSPLTAQGEQQAQQLALALREHPVVVLHSSDTRRALHTLQPLARALQQQVQSTPALREPSGARRSTQFLDATQAAALLASLATTTPAPSTPSAPAETHAEVVTRLRRFLADLPTAPGGVVVLCSHYVTLNVLVRLLIDPREPPASLWAHFDNASVTRVDLPAHRQPPTGLLRYLNWAPL